MRAVAPGLLAAALAAGAAFAQVDPGAPPGAVQTVHSARGFDSYDLPVGPFGPESRTVRDLEGAVEWRAHRLDDPEATVASVMHAYASRLAGMGFEPVFECEGEGCGGFDFRFGAEILPAPGMRVDVRDFAQLSAARPGTGEHVSVLVSRVLDAIHIQTVAVAPADTRAVALENTPQPGTALDPQGERTLMAALKQDGHVRVEGLEFEPGGVALSPASAGALDMLARLLDRNDGLKVAIVGHSDNQGTLELNVDLSRRRAGAVMQALVERGVPAGQMEAHGLGFLAPVASNATEDGRSANRRVELVLR
ncbi:MAG TPA: OmpA family protein [Paracoccaceae bacterium]|nr:OmpA family protein [Paracoccaceae bacterium]